MDRLDSHHCRNSRGASGVARGGFEAPGQLGLVAGGNNDTETTQSWRPVPGASA